MFIPASQAKNKFGKMILDAQKSPVFIERHGLAVAVLVSLETFAQYEEAKMLLQELVAREAKYKKP